MAKSQIIDYNFFLLLTELTGEERIEDDIKKIDNLLKDFKFAEKDETKAAIEKFNRIKTVAVKLRSKGKPKQEFKQPEKQNLKRIKK